MVFSAKYGRIRCLVRASGGWLAPTLGGELAALFSWRGRSKTPRREEKKTKQQKKRFENLLKKFSISGKLLIPIKYRNCIFILLSTKSRSEVVALKQMSNSFWASMINRNTICWPPVVLASVLSYSFIAFFLIPFKIRTILNQLSSHRTTPLSEDKRKTQEIKNYITT